MCLYSSNGNKLATANGYKGDAIVPIINETDGNYFVTNKAAHQLIYGKRSLMDNETLQQLYYAIPFLSKWVGSGSDIWGFSYASPVKTDVKLNGRYVDTKELSDYAIQAKRSGDYAEAIGAYFQTMMACMNKNGKIPVAHVRGFFKVLVCVNYFHLAFTLVSTVYADMQTYRGYVDPEERSLFEKYFKQLASLSIMVIDRKNFSAVAEFAENYSGSYDYKLQRTESEIIQDIKMIREDLRNVYGI